MTEKYTHDEIKECLESDARVRSGYEAVEKALFGLNAKESLCIMGMVQTDLASSIVETKMKRNLCKALSGFIDILPADISAEMKKKMQELAKKLENSESHINKDVSDAFESLEDDVKTATFKDLPANVKKDLTMMANDEKPSTMPDSIKSMIRDMDSGVVGDDVKISVHEIKLTKDEPNDSDKDTKDDTKGE